MKRTIVEEETAAAGVKRMRVLTLVDYLHRTDMITYDEWVAGGQLRNMHRMLMPTSEGVSSYGLSPGVSDPTRRGDRKAKRMTGIEISAAGEITRGPSRANRSAKWRYEDALFAMAGVHDEEGQKVLDQQAVDLMLRAVDESEGTLTQEEIGRLRSCYSGAKQLPAAGGMFIKECLRRLALHFKMVRGNATS